MDSYLLDATTILPRRSLMSARLVVRAKTAMISLDREVCQDQDANTTDKCKLR